MEKKIREISVDGCRLLGFGAYGKVYQLDDETVVKLYNENVPLEFVEGKKASAKSAFLLGIPTAISFDIVKCGNCYGTVYEMFNAKTVAQLIDEEPARIKELAYRMAMTLKELNKIEVPKNMNFVNRKDVLKKWALSMQPVLTEDELKKIIDFIDSIPDRRTFLHGDFNSKNIMVQNNELQLIDIGDAAYGHPVFDVAMVMLAYIILPNRPKLDEATKRGFLGFDPAFASEIWGVMCSTYFSVQSKEEVEAITMKILPLTKLYIAFQAIETGRSTPEIIAEYVIRREVLPTIKEWDGLGLDF